MSRSRDVAQILGKTDAANEDNHALLNSSSGLDSAEVVSLVTANSSDLDSAHTILLINANAPVAFPSGTLMLFQQTAAPTGWTKSTTHNDKAIRVVSGSAGTGGSAAFSTALATPALSGSTGAHTLTTSEIPSHTHGITTRAMHSSGTNDISLTNTANTTTAKTTGSAGSGGSHSHSMSGTATINVHYVDVTIAEKD